MTREPVGEHYVRKLLAMSSCFGRQDALQGLDGQGASVCLSEPCACAQTLLQEIGRPLQDKIERLTLENWQLKGALGYPVPGDILQGPFKCGLCEARTLEEGQAMTREPEIFELLRADNVQLRAEIERLNARIRQDAEAVLRALNEIDHLQLAVNEQWPLEYGKLRAEVERLRALSQNNAHSWDAIVRERNELRAEVERLRAALCLMDEFAWTAVTADCEEARVGLNERLAAVRAALEPKP